MQAIDRLVALMARLRDPERGCPWDLEQDFASIAPHTLEEAYEVDDAIRRGDLAALRDELGDLLLQVVFHARMAEEAGLFSLADVAETLCEKLVRRHPHVFGDAEAADAAAVVGHWEAAKAAERGAASALDGVPKALPALARAAKLGRRAERAGFGDLVAPAPEAPAGPEDPGAGLFARVQEARREGTDLEAALRAHNARVEAAFRAREAESRAAAGEPHEGE